MENAAEALKMGAWVLIFVVALSICISSFTQARETMDAILEYNDEEYSYTYIESNNNSTKRIVGFESIMPTIHRAYVENYKIIFPSDYVLYTEKDSSGNKTDINYIDLEQESISETTKQYFIMAILYGKESLTADQQKNYFPNIEFSAKGLYEEIKGKSFVESLGVYYQDETNLTEESTILDANKTEKRVITYTEYK